MPFICVPCGLDEKKKGYYWRNYLLLNWCVQLWDYLVAGFTAVQGHMLQQNLSEFGAIKIRFSFAVVFDMYNNDFPPVLMQTDLVLMDYLSRGTPRIALLLYMAYFVRADKFLQICFHSLL